MDTNIPMHLHPTLAILAEELALAGLPCQVHIQDPDQTYRGIRLYHTQTALRKDILYLLRPAETQFPFDSYSYVSSAPLPGQANHLSFSDIPDEWFLDCMMDIFSKLAEWEDAIDLLVHRHSNLQNLCELAAQILENPVCIHDDWFIMTAMSQGVSEIMAPEYLMSSVKGFIPRAIVEDFKYDTNYLETYAFHTTQLWTTPASPQTSLYANLWDGTVYCGRLLILKKNREFRKADYLIADILAQRAVQLMRNNHSVEQEVFRNMDDVIFSILRGEKTESADQAQLLAMLRWSKSDRFLCVRIQYRQDTGNTVNAHILHSDLFRTFPGSYILFAGHEQVLVINLTCQDCSHEWLNSHLKSLCREYRLYAGISSPVLGMHELHSAYYQAGIALEQIFRQRGESSILPFSDCVLAHITQNLPTPLLPNHLVSPELVSLIEHDRQKGTAYFETLREFLLQERDIPRTAEALIIHRTTLIYRLKKIDALIDANLDDPWQRLQLMLSLWVLETQRDKL